MSKKAFGTYHIAKICHVAPITVGRWIEMGKLPFFTTGGGHRRVWDQDLVKFLNSHNYPIPKNLRSLKKSSVLIVEDDPVTRRFIRRIIQKKMPQYQIFEAKSGYEAGEIISSLHPNLVILDIWLPGIDGFMVCKQIRKNKLLKNIKILAISVGPIEKTEVKVLKAGADSFLQKPFKMEDLIKKVLVLTR